MNSIFEVLYCRRPVLNYTAPPICEINFSGSGFPVIVLGDFSSLDAPGGVRFGGYGGFHLSWNRYPGAICYNVYRAETDDPDAPLVIVFECITDTDVPLPPGCYRVSAITPDGETALSDPAVCYFVLPMLPPEVTTMAASSISATQATLNGIINAVGQFSTAYFEWGTTIAYGNTTPVQNMGSSFDNMPYNAIVTGLAQNVLYHYRAIGFNASGEGDGEDMTFVTANPAGGIVWDLVWAITDEAIGDPAGTINKTLGPDSFDVALTQPTRPPTGSNTVGVYDGGLVYTGPASACHLHLIVSNTGTTGDDFIQSAALTISVDGNPVLETLFPEELSNDGTYDYDFNIPLSVGANVNVHIEIFLGNQFHPTHTRWQGTLTTL